MPNTEGISPSAVDNGGADNAKGTDQRQGSVPKISLLKGGGAIQSIGEKFAANPVTECVHWRSISQDNILTLDEVLFFAAIGVTGAIILELSKIFCRL